ncbi:hypothetical protein HNQ60_005258 [Povalibacter uvarum]|uniref:Secreted protein n=1 Tax=Povalibacter uvarum TaxID=732238 RepID=A0A841HTV4_9GAMM|nr:hypothetical protein [Povalibacter uvarum]MBB6096336.1 hypothetical protein [Povalibacter uvarum]
MNGIRRNIRLLIVGFAAVAATAAAHSHADEDSSASIAEAAAQTTEAGNDERAALLKKAKEQRKWRFSRYQPPTGIGDLKWGERPANFERYRPVNIEVTFTPGRYIWSGNPCLATADCDINHILNSLRIDQHEQFQMFAEFVIPEQGMRFTNTGVVMYPVTYMFCANWAGGRGKPPPDIEQRLVLCGARLVFESQTGEALAALREDEPTNYERVLFELIERHGRPPNYWRSPQVIVKTDDAIISEPRKRRFDNWAWCPFYRGGARSCGTSVNLAFNEKTGNGAVIFATRAIWDFAAASDSKSESARLLHKLLYEE